MKDTCKEIIAEFHSEPIPMGFERELDFPTLKDIRKATVLIGMRRSGKTWALYQHMHTLLDAGLKQEQFVYINFEDDRLSLMQVTDLQDILNAYFELYPQYANDPNVHFFFDEIHEIEGWDKFIRRLLDKEKAMLFITGSSAKMLSKDIATALRGRTLEREIFPVSFSEYLQYRDVEVQRVISPKLRAAINHHMNHYLIHGGFPETLNQEPALAREILQNYMDTVIYRDIIERHNISNTQAVKQLLIHCLKNPASILSINKVYNTFQSQKIAVSKNALYDYMAYLEDAYCIFSVPQYHFSAKKTQLQPKKIYPVDTGLITAYTVKTDYEDASRLETFAFLALRRRYQDVFYYQTDSGKEVDFLVLTPEKNIELFQVCKTLKDNKTREREVSALVEAMTTFKLDSACIITLDEEETIEVEPGKITCIPCRQLQ